MSLTQSYSYTCAANSGGATNLYLANSADITSMTLTSGEWSAITMVATKTFFQYEVDLDSLEFVQNIVKGDRRSYGVEKMINGFLPKMSTSQRNALQDLIDSSPCGLVAILVDNNGNQWVIGYSERFGTDRSCYIETLESSTGIDLTANNGTQFQLKQSDHEKARVFTGSIAGLL